MTGLVRIWALAVLCAGIWLLAVYGQYRPAPAPATAPVGSFSALRASAALGKVLGPEKPHPVGTPENAALRGRLLDVLAGMGVQARTETAMSCYSEARWGSISCGTVNNIVAPVTSGTGDPVLLMTHLDSVAAGPGACDDGCGMATLLETIRALKAANFKGRHPVMALFTDGEEPGMMGAAAFLRRGEVHPLAVINIEARGNQGPSYLFQTSAGDGRLIDLYAHSVRHYATSSLYSEIYRHMPNDTDLTPFLKAGITGYNFALVGNVAAYHTPLDVRAGIDLSGLQQHGEAALNLARGLANSTPAALAGTNAVYLDVLGRWLPRLSSGWALPLGVAGLVLIMLAAALQRRNVRVPERPWRALAAPPLLLAGAVAAGFGLHGLAVWLSGQSDPSFAHPVYLRLSLAFGVWVVALAVSRWAGTLAGWGWMAVLAIACALWAPGLSPYFLFPLLVAAPLLLISARGGRGTALLVAGVAMLVIWLQLNAATEPLMGLKAHFLFSVTAAFALVPLLPLLAPAGGRALAVSALLSLLLALGLAVTAGLVDTYSAAAPRPLNITYVENGGHAAWMTDGAPGAKLEAAVSGLSGKGFGKTRVRIAGLGLGGVMAPAGAPRLTPPRLIVDRVDASGATITLQGSADADGMMLRVPARAPLTALVVNGVRMPVTGGTLLMCHTPDCAHARIRLEGDMRGVWLHFAETRHGLPPWGAGLATARPAQAAPWGRGDRTVVGNTARLEPGPR